ncbi:MAG: neuraminidase, partial [Treponema sp.]|nr:neuraminidase [Treponema sp.]
SYRFDTKILKDGTHVVFIKVWDKYDIIGLYSNLINIDNTPPTLTIERPLDGTSSVGQVSVSGQATDGISLQNVVIGIRSTEGVPIPDHLASFVREPDSILIETLDISALPDGLYSLDIQATDRAGNITRASRYIELAKEKNPNFIEVLYPMNGETVQGQFNLYGYVGGADKASYVSLELNGTEVDIASVTNAGYFRFTLDENTGLVPDTNIIVIKSDFNGRGETISYPRMIEYKRTGPWITIDTLAMGDYAYQRPYLRGLTGYALSEDDRDALADKKASKTAKAQVEAKTPAFVEISFDDGKTFRPAAMKKKGAWEYRIEDWDMEQGMYYLLIKAVMKNGETAVTKTLVQINKTPPVITLISPKTGGRYNQTIDFTGIVTDDVEVNSAHFVLRSGSKESYEVPGFMQGMYLDGHFLGGTLWDIGAGLSFFDDNVKLQFQYGQFTKEQYAAFGENNPRFYGNTFGLKLLAGVYALNFGSFGGPDWRWLGLSVSIGANFSYFTETQSGSPTILPALLMQLEFPKISIPKMKMFRNVSVYAEPQLWFVSTDAEVETTGVETILFRITGGLRIYVF